MNQAYRTKFRVAGHSGRNPKSALFWGFMKTLLIVLFGLTLRLYAQVADSSATPTHFRWSEREAHELDYANTIKTLTVLSPTEKANLTSAVLQQLKQDKDISEEMTEQQLQSLAEDTRVEMVDLNGDGKPEIIAQANGLGPCGGTGNCIFWIFERTASGLKLLLNTNDRSQVTLEKILIRPWSTNGYRDFVLSSHSNATSRNLVWFQFADDAYRIHGCYFSTSIGERGEALNMPVIWREKCSKSLGPLR